MVGIVSTVSRAANLMSPPGTDTSTGRDGDDVVVLELDVGVAREVGMVDVLDGVVAIRSTDTPELTLIGAVDGHLLEDGVGVDSRGRQEERKTLHVDLFVDPRGFGSEFG